MDDQEPDTSQCRQGLGETRDSPGEKRVELTLEYVIHVLPRSPRP